MRAFITSILAIGCAVILILGNIHWGQKTAIKTEEKVLGSAKENTHEEIEEGPLDEDQIVEYLSLAANWPEEALLNFGKALKEGRPYHILIAGSTALGEGPTSWPEMVKQSLIDSYGEDTISVSVKTFDLTSKEFLDSGAIEDLKDFEADMILFEPFILKDNGVVVIEDSIVNIQEILSSLEETTFILQPPFPIVGSNWYPIQVRELEKFAAENQIPYFNHWEAWPQQSNELLNPDKDAPTEQGHEVWANYIVNQFITRP